MSFFTNFKPINAILRLFFKENLYYFSFFQESWAKNSLIFLQCLLKSFFKETSICIRDVFVCKSTYDNKNKFRKHINSIIIDDNEKEWKVGRVYLNNDFLTRDSIVEFLDITKDISDSIVFLKKKYSLKLIGSYLLNAGIECSDIDFYSDEEIEVIAKKLEKDFNIRIVGKRLLSIKFNFGNIEIDIQFDKKAYEFNKKLFEKYKDNIDRQQLLRKIKLWAQNRKINKQAFGYLGGTSLAILISMLDSEKLTMYDFFKNFDLELLPSSYTEFITMSSRYVIEYEVNRGLDLSGFGDCFEIVKERNFYCDKFLNLKLYDDYYRFQSSYLKFSRLIEKKGGLIDIIKKDDYKIFIFGIENEKEILKTFLEVERIKNYKIY